MQKVNDFGADDFIAPFFSRLINPCGRGVSKIVRAICGEQPQGKRDFIF